MKFYLYPGINLENHAMPPPKLANSVDPLAAASLYHPSDNNTHFLFAFWSEKMVEIISIFFFFNLPRLILWPRM